MIELAFVILFLIGEASRDSFWIAPEDPFFSAQKDLRLSCEEAESKFMPFNWQGRDRLSGFTLFGNSNCQRTIFEYGDRNSFVDFVTKHSAARARSIAMTLKSRLQLEQKTKSIDTRPLGIEVISDDTSMNQFVKMTFIHELSQVLGPTTVSRGAIDESFKGPQLRIKILRLQDPIDFLKVSFLTDEVGKVNPWQNL